MQDRAIESEKPIWPGNRMAKKNNFLILVCLFFSPIFARVQIYDHDFHHLISKKDANFKTAVFCTYRCCTVGERQVSENDYMQIIFCDCSWTSPHRSLLYLDRKKRPVVKRFKQESMYGLSAKTNRRCREVAVREGWPLMEVRLYLIEKKLFVQSSSFTWWFLVLSSSFYLFKQMRN